MRTTLPRQPRTPTDRDNLRGTEREPPDRTAAPSLLPLDTPRYAAAPIQRRDNPGGITPGGITAAENAAVRRLSAGRVDLHGIGATIESVPATDARLNAVQARSLTQGRHALISDPADRGHELWHIAQQAMGRVRPTERIGGQPVNAQAELEREADRMGSAIAAEDH